MSINRMVHIEETFRSLPKDEREAIISHGAAMRLSELKNRLFVAHGKIRDFEELYHTKLDKLNQDGLPDDASIELHEDFITWNYWTEVARQCENDIATLSM